MKFRCWLTCFIHFLGGPDVAKERTDHDKASLLLDYNRKTSFDSASSSDLSYIDEDDDENQQQQPPQQENSTNIIQKQPQIDIKNESNKNSVSAASKNVVAESDDSSSDDEDDDFLNKIVSQKAPTRLTIKLHVTDRISSSWDSVSFTF